MTSRFHPRLLEYRHVAGNWLRRALVQWPQTAFQLAGWTALITLAGLGLSRIDGDRIGLALRLLVEQPLATGLAFAGFGGVMVHSATVSLAHELRHGWWGAMPVPVANTQRTLRLTALTYTALASTIVLAVLLGIAAISDRWQHWLQPFITIALAGLTCGALLGYLSARRDHARPLRSGARDHSSAPLLAIPLLDHAHLHHLPDWQRRETLRRWRSGGRVWQIGAFGLLIPANDGVWSLGGLLLLGICLIWYGLALRASEDVIARASALFAALPIRFDRFAAASLRYPFFAWAATAGIGALGLLLQSASMVILLIYPLVLGLGSALALSLSLRYRQRPRIARLRAPAESLLLVALAYSLPPLAIVLALGLIARHYHQARSPS